MGKSNKEKHWKHHDKPTATQLTSEQAKQKLLDFVKRSDHAASDSLEIMFPEQANCLHKKNNQLEGFENLFLVRRCG
jgi:hypothetical protein